MLILEYLLAIKTKRSHNFHLSRRPSRQKFYITKNVLEFVIELRLQLTMY